MKKRRLVIIIIIVIALAIGVLFYLYPKIKGDTLQFGSATNSPMVVSVRNNQISINLNKIGSKGKAQVYAYQANEYQSHDKIRGISTAVKSSSKKVGTYQCGSKQTITFNRYSSDGRDGLYNKYYVVQDNKILCGPVYATTIASKKQKIGFDQKSIKGLFNEDSTDMSVPTDLNVNSITVNINVAALVYANEDQNGNKLTAPADAYTMKVNGQTYYFNKGTVDQIDAKVIVASKKHMNVIGVICGWKNDDYHAFAASLRYDSPKSQALLGTNTSNGKGRDYLIAMMEFLGKRYSQSTNTGLINTYVIGNEIDFTHYFYDCDNLDTFMEEYSRTLRLSDLALKKYAGDVQVAVPFTHYWTGYVAKMGKECPGAALRPCDMLKWLAKYTNKRGAYDWAIDPHCYGSTIASSNTAEADVQYGALTGNYKTAKQITFSNFEVWKQILSLDAMKYQGKMRNIYLTESGTSSYKLSTKSKNEQAASLAQVYYKVAQFSFVKSFNYYRLKDNAGEIPNGLSCGLLDTNGKQKPAYKVYKYIDTKDTLKYSNPYLKYINYEKNGDTNVNVSNGKIKSWKDTMTVYSSSMDWNKDFDIKKVYRK